MTEENKKLHFGLIMAVYLLGIFMGAIDTGIVTPARTVIQADMGVSDQTGIWLITIYTLAYAASIPIMGKLADRLGRKNIYLTSIFLFAVGSLLCGLSQNFGSFPMLLVSRAIQAIGGGGIVPVATAEFGTTFPPEKRGMALGLVGGVFGVANIFGASAGSAVLDIFGTANWQFIFYINLPISVFILIAGFLVLPNTRAKEVGKIDGLGICILTVMVLSLMYGLKNIDFFDFLATLQSTSVYPFLLLFLLLLPIFVWVEKRAADPVMNLSYFKSSQINITLVLAFITGVVMMGMIFVPQFSENAMKMESGSGGYFVIIMGLFAGVGAPISGTLIDKYGVKIVLGFGLFASIAGSLFLIFVTANYPSLLTVVISLILIGLGIGFTMGTPLNYMMLANTKEEESNSALATLSLVRSIGTAIAPAIMVGFIAHAGAGVQGDIMKLLPHEVTMPELPYAQELTEEFAALQKDDKTKAQFAAMDLPDLTVTTMEISMEENDDFVISDDLTELMSASDVTNIVEHSKTFASAMFEQMTPDIIADIQDGVDSGIDGLQTAMIDMGNSLPDMEEAYNGMGKGIAGMNSGIAGQQQALAQLKQVSAMMADMEAKTKFDSVVDLIPANVKNSLPQSVLADLSSVKTAADLNQKIAGLQSSLTTVQGKLTEMEKGKDGCAAGSAAVQKQKEEQTALLGQYQNAYAVVSSSSQEGATLGDRLSEEEKASLPQEILSDISGMTSLDELEGKVSQIQGSIDGLDAQIQASQKQEASLDQGIAQMQEAVTAQSNAIEQLQSVAVMMNKYTNYNSVVDLIPADVKANIPANVLKELSGVKTQAQLDQKISELQKAIDTLYRKLSQTEAGRKELASGIHGIKTAQGSMETTLFEMQVLRDAVPANFSAAENTYLGEIDAEKGTIESVFQKELNEGFKQVYATVAIASLLGLLLLAFYRDGRRKNGMLSKSSSKSSSD